MTNNKGLPPIIEPISISTQAGKTAEPRGLFLSDQLRQDGRRERGKKKQEEKIQGASVLFFSPAGGRARFSTSPTEPGY